MKDAAPWIKQGLAAVFAVMIVIGALPMLLSPAHAAVDLPLASSSALTGVTFDDKPLLLPVQRNFQMAMLTTGSELGRTCGPMEAYGWRMSQSEQGRVNQIFNKTVDRLHAMNYTVTPQNISSVSKDITLFTADSASRHFIFLWSAGDQGLVMTLCETSAAQPAAAAHTLVAAPAMQSYGEPNDIVSSGLENNARAGGFTLLGRWQGNYICAQGYTGGTLEITRVSGENFEGIFKFYPTPKNESVATGSYRVNGQYDKASGRVLINPGKWIARPPHYYNTVIVGQFDEGSNTLSAFFQGVSGCTSFEARHVSAPHIETPAARKHKKKVKPPRRKIVKPVVSTPVSDIPVSAPSAVTTPVPAPAVQPPAPAASGLAVNPAALAPASPSPPPSSVAPTVSATHLSDPVLPSIPAQDGITLTAPTK